MNSTQLALADAIKKSASKVLISLACRLLVFGCTLLCGLFSSELSHSRAYYDCYYYIFVFKPSVPHRESPIQFSKPSPRIGKPRFDFQSPRPASGWPFLLFVGRFPHRSSRFYFSLALSRIGVAIFHFHWLFPASG